MVNTFLIWPHNKDKLGRLLNFMNSLHLNIKFTMEIGNGGSLPFLAVLVYCKVDDSVGHKIYRKPNYIDLSLYGSGHHHLSHKRSVVFTLVYHAWASSVKDSLKAELCHLQKVFSVNGHINCVVWWALPRSSTNNKTADLEEEKRCKLLPFYGAVSMKFGRLAMRSQLRPVYHPLNKLGQWLHPLKDSFGLRTPGIYKIQCSCC